MRKRCYKCGRQMDEGDRDLLCDQCAALATGAEKATVEVVLELTLHELGNVACALANAAAELQYSQVYDSAATETIKTLKEVAEIFRNAPEDERRRQAADAHAQWRHAQE